MAVGTFGVVERIGGALAPQLLNLNIWMGFSGSAMTVTTAIMALSLVAGSAFLPEDKDAIMKDVNESKEMQERPASSSSSCSS